MLKETSLNQFFQKTNKVELIPENLRIKKKKAQNITLSTRKENTITACKHT